MAVNLSNFHTSCVKRYELYLTHKLVFLVFLFRKNKTNPQQDAKFEENVNRMLAKDPLELETGPNDDTTIELNISTDRSVTDSALGDGISDSQPISGSISMPIVENIIPPQVVPIPSRSTQTLNPETSFRPVEMNLSETKSSSVLSQDIADGELSTNDSENFREMIDDRLRQGNVQAATGNVDAKMAEFLHKVKNDDRFQISLSTVKSRNLPNEDTKLTFGTDIDSSTLNESKFRRGLQDPSDESDQN